MAAERFYGRCALVMFVLLISLATAQPTTGAPPIPTTADPATAITAAPVAPTTAAPVAPTNPVSDVPTTARPAQPTSQPTEGPAAPPGPPSEYTDTQKFGISCATFSCVAVAWSLFCFIYSKVADRCIGEESAKTAVVYAPISSDSNPNKL